MTETTHAAADPLAMFPLAERQTFHAADIKAGTAIVLLVSGIFATGILIYTIVAIACL